MNSRRFSPSSSTGEPAARVCPRGHLSRACLLIQRRKSLVTGRSTHYIKANGHTSIVEWLVSDEIFSIGPDRLQRPQSFTALAWQMVESNTWTLSSVTPGNGCSSAQSLSLSLSRSLSSSGQIGAYIFYSYIVAAVLPISSAKGTSPFPHISGLQKKRNFCGRVVLILQHPGAEVPSSAAEEELRNWQL